MVLFQHNFKMLQINLNIAYTVNSYDIILIRLIIITP